MASVTQRIKQIKQPRGGYIKPKEFEELIIEDGVNLNPKENIHPTLVGLAVDYLTRYASGTPVREAFKISFMGAYNVNQQPVAMELFNTIKGLDDESIISACKLVGYDCCYRVGPEVYVPIENIMPDKDTIENIRNMVIRTLKFIDNCGPIVKDGFTFEGAYTYTVTSGDGDFLTESTLWDLKVSSKPPTSAHTLQLLMYYIMGMCSIHKKDFNKIDSIGIFNPRLNRVYSLDISKIPFEVIKEVSEQVIGYRLI